MTRLKCHVLRVFKNKSQHPSICIQSEESELHFPLTNTMQHSSSQANFKKKKKWRKAQHLLPPFCTSCSHYCPFQLRFCPYHYMKQLLVRSTVMSLSFNSVHAFFYLPLLWQPCFYKHLLALTLWPSCSERFSEHAIFSITFI